MAFRRCNCSDSSLSAPTRRRGCSAPNCAAACSPPVAARSPASSRSMRLKSPAAAKTIRSPVPVDAVIRAKCWWSEPSRSRMAAAALAASGSAKSPIIRPPACMALSPSTSCPSPPPRPMVGPGIRGPPALPMILMSSVRWPLTSCCPGSTGSFPTSRSGPWASIMGCAASTSNPTSMNSFSASIAGAPGMPHSDPCWVSPLRTSRCLTRYWSHRKQRHKASQKLIDNQAELTAYSKDPSDGESNVISLNLESLERIGDIKNHPLHDVTVVKIGDIPRQDQPSANAKESTQRALSMEPGVVVTKKAKLGIVGVPEEGIKIFNQMLIGNDIIVFGYPTSLGLQTKPQLDLRRPLLRKGIVAGENLLTRSIVLDCPVY